MSESALREAERRWRSSGADADLVAFLRERLRAGQVARERVHLAALLGSAAAAAVLEDEAPAPARDGTSETVPGWIGALHEHGVEADVRAAVAIARHFLSEWRSHRNDGPDPVLTALEALEGWVLASPADRAPLAQALALDLDLAGDDDDALEFVSPAAVAWGVSSARGEPTLFDAPREGLLHAVADEVVPWALGLEDPVAVRAAGGAKDEPARLADDLLRVLNQIWVRRGPLDKGPEDLRDERRYQTLFGPQVELRIIEDCRERILRGERCVRHQLDEDPLNQGDPLELVDRTSDDQQSLGTLRTTGPRPRVIGRLRVEGHRGRITLLALTRPKRPAKAAAPDADLSRELVRRLSACAVSPGERMLAEDLTRRVESLGETLSAGQRERAEKILARRGG